MNETAVVEVFLRIPGNWSHPDEFFERLPPDHRLTSKALILPDGTEIELIAKKPDNQFAMIFNSSCRTQPSRSELEQIENYTSNVCLIGPGGSTKAASTMMRAGAAVLKAGGAGVFIDNSLLAHGRAHWIEMAEDGGPDALSFAFCGIVQGQKEVRTMGMHVFGLPEFVMRRSDADVDDTALLDIIRYACTADHPIGNGHLLADANGSRFKAEAAESEQSKPGSPMYNPFGQLNLVSIEELSERN